MTPERVLEVVAIYEKRFEDIGVKPLKLGDGSGELDIHSRDVRHLAWMLGEIKGQIAANEIEKAMRWLGFVQGALWCYEWYTIDQMREHNRS